MKYIYGDNPSKIEERAMRKKIACIAEAQNCMTEALSHGNLNQVGRSAWGNMIDLVQEMVVDEINDAIIEWDYEKLMTWIRGSKNFRLKCKITEMSRDLVQMTVITVSNVMAK